MRDEPTFSFHDLRTSSLFEDIEKHDHPDFQGPGCATIIISDDVEGRRDVVNMYSASINVGFMDDTSVELVVDHEGLAIVS